MTPPAALWRFRQKTPGLRKIRSPGKCDELYEVVGGQCGDLVAAALFPLGERQAGSLHRFAEADEELGNALFQHHAERLAQALFALLVAAEDMQRKGGIRDLVDQLDAAVESDLSRLMRTAGGRTAGNVDLRQRAVGDFRLCLLYTSPSPRD